MQNAPLFTGVCTALVTPFHDKQIDFACLEYLLDLQMEAGVSAVCVCGTTGEAATLSDTEQNEILCCAVERCKGKIKVIAGTGSNNTVHAVELSQKAAKSGADVVLVVTPYYNKATEKGLELHYTAIADAITCPVILYNVPSRTGVDISADLCAKLSNHKNIIGIKEASGAVSKTSRILAKSAPGFCVWSGNDDEIVPQMSVGAMGVISVFSNLCPKQAVSITDAFLSRSYAEAAILQRKYIDMIDALFCEVNPIPIKEAMNLAGYRVGAPRLPLCEMKAENKNKLKTIMAKHGLL